MNIKESIRRIKEEVRKYDTKKKPGEKKKVNVLERYNQQKKEQHEN